MRKPELIREVQDIANQLRDVGTKPMFRGDRAGWAMTVWPHIQKTRRHWRNTFDATTDRILPTHEGVDALLDGLRTALRLHRVAVDARLEQDKEPAAPSGKGDDAPPFRDDSERLQRPAREEGVVGALLQLVAPVVQDGAHELLTLGVADALSCVARHPAEATVPLQRLQRGALSQIPRKRALLRSSTHDLLLTGPDRQSWAYRPIMLPGTTSLPIGSNAC